MVRTVYFLCLATRCVYTNIIWWPTGARYITTARAPGAQYSGTSNPATQVCTQAFSPATKSYPVPLSTGCNLPGRVAESRIQYPPRISCYCTRATKFALYQPVDLGKCFSCTPASSHNIVGCAIAYRQPTLLKK